MVFGEGLPMVEELGPLVFDDFSKLPIELRLKIWGYNLPGPRILPVHAHACSFRAFRDANDSVLTRVFSSPAKVPSNLHVCRESRAETLRTYRLLFGGHGHVGGIFLDPSIDIIYFEARSDTTFSDFVESVSMEHVAHTRYLAINAAAWDKLNTAVGSGAVLRSYFRTITKHFSHLKKLIFVRSDQNPLYSPDSVLVTENGGDLRLRRRVLEGILDVADQQPGAAFPPWDIMDISAEPEPAVAKYDESMLGYAPPQHSLADIRHDDGLPVEFARTRTLHYKQIMARKLEDLEQNRDVQKRYGLHRDTPPRFTPFA
ncbi:hypothetical protein JX266_009765 [Neoarthrinium moseri]|nr:hypothetical protein JX266_009765 [Neoarthrinium moseri]